MLEDARLAEIPEADWAATPLSVRVLLVALLATVEQHETLIRELQTRLGLHSQTSSKPPASDPPDATPRPARTPRSRVRGAQQDHRGHHRTLLPSDQADEMVPHHPPTCSQCQHMLSADLPDAAPLRRQQVWEIPPIDPFLTEHQYRRRWWRYRPNALQYVSGDEKIFTLPIAI